MLGLFAGFAYYLGKYFMIICIMASATNFNDRTFRYKHNFSAAYYEF